MLGKTSDDPYIQELESVIRYARNNSEWRAEYMIYSANYWDAIREGRADGRQMGLEEGRAEAIAELIRNLYESGKTREEIASWCKLDPEYVSKILG